MEQDAIGDLKRDYINRLLVEKKRMDGRGPADVRDVSVETNVVTSAAGSARVKWGETEVLVGSWSSRGRRSPIRRTRACW